VSRVTDVSSMFAEACAIDGDIGSWDVSVVRNMKEMFWGAYSFNKDIESWDVSRVRYAMSMFSGANSFPNHYFLPILWQETEPLRGLYD
jgi:hypothetical protein